MNHQRWHAMRKLMLRSIGVMLSVLAVARTQLAKADSTPQPESRPEQLTMTDGLIEALPTPVPTPTPKENGKKRSTLSNGRTSP